MASPQALQQIRAADTLKHMGRIGESLAFSRSAVEMDPNDHAVLSHLLFGMHYDPAMTPAALFLEHQAYGARFPRANDWHLNRRDPDRRINIGYVSSDLHQHPVGYLMMPVLAAHDRERFKIHCYYGHASADRVTAFCQEASDVWHQTLDLTDADLASTIRADGIDILVDLNGHTGHNRLPVMARKPAPVQATWAGYFGTTGLSQIDYLIGDRFLAPPGSERYATERIVRLPDGYVCFAMPGHAPPVGLPPAKRPGEVTFGCFNNLIKINAGVVAIWSRLLRELPDARLILKARRIDDPAIRDRLPQLFTIEGVADRVSYEPPSPHPEYLARYNDIDIALDPFPFSGGTVTLDALWMGVPVITMPGDTWASRHSLSYLSVLGLTGFVARDPASYIAIAKGLATDLPLLAAMRETMRERIAASPLSQARVFTAGLEETYRQMWRTYCAA